MRIGHAVKGVKQYCGRRKYMVLNCNTHDDKSGENDFECNRDSNCLSYKQNKQKNIFCRFLVVFQILILFFFFSICSRKVQKGSRDSLNGGSQCLRSQTVENRYTYKIPFG